VTVIVASSVFAILDVVLFTGGPMAVIAIVLGTTCSVYAVMRPDVNHAHSFGVSDWLRDGDSFALRIPFADHGVRNPSPTIFERTGSGFQQIISEVHVDDQNTVTVRINSTPFWWRGPAVIASHPVASNTHTPPSGFSTLTIDPPSSRSWAKPAASIVTYGRSPSAMCLSKVSSMPKSSSRSLPDRHPTLKRGEPVRSTPVTWTSTPLARSRLEVVR
jgi:hypothetical protein